MKTFSEIINEIKRIKRVSKDNQVAKLLNLRPKAFALRKMRERIPYEEIVIFCKQNNLSIDDLLLKTGYVKEKKPERFLVSEDVESYGEEFIVVPHVTGKISAGGGLVPNNTIEMKIAFRRDWIQRKGSPQNMSLVRVAGDSMEPTLESGDIVLVDHGRNFVDPNGGIYAIVFDDEIMLKRLQVLYPSKKVRVISDNSRYEAVEIEPEQIKINGKVIWFGRELER